ncbi:MAG: integration host factor subunit alpha [Desulfopila sp.]|jgi:integration host factor subunit alpha|nr:integration host factor subunit alpha [Desulfopila sp.]
MEQTNLTRKELAEAVASRLGYPRSTCADIVDSLLGTIKTSLSGGKPVKIVHFGTFTLRAKNPRNGRNPRTGESILIKKRKMVSFKPSKKLREQINE